MIVKLTALRHGDIGKIEDGIVPKNRCAIAAEVNEHASNGVAYVAYCKGLKIGYIPELKTLRGYLRDAKTQEAQSRVIEWGKATRAVRDQFRIDADNNGQAEWAATVAGLLYCCEGNPDTWLEYQAYSDLAQAGNAGGFHLRQLAVSVDGVEAF